MDFLQGSPLGDVHDSVSKYAGTLGNDEADDGTRYGDGKHASVNVPALATALEQSQRNSSQVKTLIVS